MWAPDSLIEGPVERDPYAMNVRAAD
jgi:hypothetical protein